MSANVSYDKQRGKKAITPYATREDPDERAYQYSLIWAVSVHWDVLQYPLTQ